MKKAITPENAKGEAHGYWEFYFYNDQLIFKCVFINGKKNGFEEWYSCGKLTDKSYHL